MPYQCIKFNDLLASSPTALSKSINHDLVQFILGNAKIIQCKTIYYKLKKNYGYLCRRHLIELITQGIETSE